MEVVSQCDLPVGSIVWQTWSGAVVLSVVCKATHRLRSVESPLAEEQVPIFDADRTWYDEPHEALRIATDLVPFKRRAEVIVVGHAYAPHGVATRSMQARLCVAGADKSIEIFGDRVFTYEGRIREGTAFTKSPLLWKHAAGGPGTANPVGIRHDAPPDPYGQRLIPRFQPLGLHITRPTDVIPPIGYGPIAPTWPGRLEKLHRHAHTWDFQRWNERPLPQDIDAAFFNAAPPDQQVDAIRADERIVLDNLHPELSHLVTSLSGVKPEAVVERPGKPPEAVPFICDTLWIDADKGTCSLSWRARIILEARTAPGRVHVTLAHGAYESEAAAAAFSGPSATSASAGSAAGASSNTASPSTVPGAAAGGAVPQRPQAPARPTRPPAPATPPWTPGAPPERFPIDRCAALAATIALRSGDTAKLLKDNELSDDEWDAIEHHWSQVLKKDAAEGETRRLEAYDQAYVSRLESERGPITPVEYARIALAQDRDRAALTRALRDIGLPWGASQRILRVFAERMATDPDLAAQVREAMRE